MDDNEEEEKVGYGHPPKAHRFKKGQSPNPKGRPRKDQSIRQILRSISRETATVSTKDGERKITGLEWTLRLLLQRAMKGDNRATAKYLDLYLNCFGLGENDDEFGRNLAAEDREILTDFLKKMVAENENG
jgi:hypothetical protein